MNGILNNSRPDNCDGTYESSCDSSRAYTNITDILQTQGRDDLLDYMDEYWVDINGDNESFWAHEWGKHGTCINTIDPDCYQGYTAQEEVGDFFEKVVDLFKGLDTYKVWHPFHFSVRTCETNEFLGSCCCWHYPKHLQDLYSECDPECTH